MLETGQNPIVSNSAKSNVPDEVNKYCYTLLLSTIIQLKQQICPQNFSLSLFTTFQNESANRSASTISTL